MSSRSELTNLSYTNRDFNTIYPELLEYAKSISYKWDPTSSDESDPGIVLLKLASIIGDKDNYNIDKNVLELMPVSVTQLPNARQVFEQCGYSMKHYRSAEGQVTIDLKTKFVDEDGTPLADAYIFPIFTTFCNEDETIVYTSTHDILIKNSEPQISIDVIQGTPVEYTINNSNVIKLENLDSNNRLYFPDYDIAENGVFITVNGESDYWQRVDVLDVEKVGTPCYKFGLSIEEGSCYVEFPSDIGSLIREGLCITYIRTLGSKGNVSANHIRKFYGNVVLTDTDNKRTIEATLDQFHIKNSIETYGGADPETIEDAYRNYQRIKNTFDTLVSTKDYSNYMIANEFASNGYVCDRTNDIQYSYKILETDQHITKLNNVVETGRKEYTGYTSATATDSTTVYIDEPKMDAFDLCVYALTYMADSDIRSVEDYQSTFTLISSQEFEDYLNDPYDSVKAICHNFTAFDKDRILMIKNKYPIRAQIISRYQLTAEQYNDVMKNIHLSLFKHLNSNKMTFGVSVDYNIIYDAIVTADDRIKAVSLEYPVYETYAVYYTDVIESGISKSVFKEVRIDNDSFGGYTPYNSSVFDDDTTYYYHNSILNRMEEYNKSTYNGNIQLYTYDSNNLELWNKFRAEIFAKNVLAGVTPLYDEDTSFNYSLSQNVTGLQTGISTVKPETIINKKDSKFTVRENENVLITAPNLVTDSNYSSYVKFLYHFNSSRVPSNSEYTLEEGEYIIFFWKASSEDNFYTYIKYDFNSDGKIISPTIDLEKTNITTDDSSLLSSLSSSGTTQPYPDLNEYITNLAGKKWVLSGTNSITTKKPNIIHINNTENGTPYIYWVTSSQEKNEKDILVSKIPFETINGTDANGDQYVIKYMYTMKSDEYFIYTNEAKTALYVLGQGTKIELTPGLSTLTTTNCPVVSYLDLAKYGPDAIDKWVTIEQSDTKRLTATEMIQHLLGPGSEITISSLGSITSNNSDPITDVISYRPDSSSSMQTLPQRTNNDIAWTARSILNLKCGPSTPQKLETGQKIILNPNVGATEVSIEGPEDDDSPSNYMMSSRDIDITGDGVVSLTSVSGVEIYNELDMLTYEESIDSSDTSVKVLSDGSLMVVPDTESITTLENGESKKSYSSTFNTKMVEGDYLIHIVDNNSSADSTVFIWDSTVATKDSENNLLNSLYDNSSTYKLSINSTVSSNGITVEVTSSEEKVAVIFSPLYKFTRETLKNIRCTDMHSTPDVFFDSILNPILKILDKDSDFNYTYRVPEENKIKNPLVANTFLYKNHVFNPYTICEWNVMSNDTNVSLLTNVR